MEYPTGKKTDMSFLITRTALRSVLSSLLRRRHNSLTAAALFPRHQHYHHASSSRLATPCRRPPPCQYRQQSLLASPWPARPAGPRRRWFPFLLKLASATVAGAAATYLASLDSVPYTNRRRLVIVPLTVERFIGDLVFAVIKEDLGPDKILPPFHPESVRVRGIASEIVRAASRGLADADADPQRRRSNKKQQEQPGPGAAAAEVHQEEISSRRRRRLLDGWEVIVVKDDGKVNATCVPGGKLVVFTGLLLKFTEDDEIATAIGHEIGHAIARHSAEHITEVALRFLLHVVTFQFLYRPGPSFDDAKMVPLLGRMELEADRIGLLLLAAAGYDPRVAPSFYERLVKTDGKAATSTTKKGYHPSHTERSRSLSQADLMNQALELYAAKIAAG